MSAGVSAVETSIGIIVGVVVGLIIALVLALVFMRRRRRLNDNKARKGGQAGCPPGILALTTRCLQTDPVQRLAFPSIVDELQRLKGSLRASRPSTPLRRADAIRQAGSTNLHLGNLLRFNRYLSDLLRTNLYLGDLYRSNLYVSDLLCCYRYRYLYAEP